MWKNTRNAVRGAALALVFSGIAAGSLAEQATTFSACYVPNVGAIYMIKLPGLPSNCLSASHVEISWTEGGEPADGSVVTVKLADGAVTTVKLEDLAVTAAKLADGAVTAAKIGTAVVGTAHLADNSVTQAKLAGDVTAGIADGAVTTAKLAEGAVTFGKIQNASALSVLGRSSSTTGIVGTISAGTDGHVLRRSGNSLDFGQVGTEGIADSAITYDRIQNVAPNSVLGRPYPSAGVIMSIPAEVDGHVLRRQGGYLLFGQVATAGIANRAVTREKLSSDMYVPVAVGRIGANCQIGAGSSPNIIGCEFVDNRFEITFAPGHEYTPNHITVVTGSDGMQTNATAQRNLDKLVVHIFDQNGWRVQRAFFFVSFRL